MSEDPTNSLPYNELQKVLKSFASSNTNNNTNNKKEVGGSCVKEAEATAAKTREQHEAMIIHQNTASDSTTSPSTPTPSTTITQTQTPESTEAKDEGDPLVTPIPQTREEAMNQLNKLRTMRDDLLAEQDRNNKFVSRYQEKVAKAERMATLHHLIPRELFVREDRYQQELEHVYKWSGISDQEIADIYLLKLKKSGIKQHGASSSVMRQQNRDPYAGFRDVPNFFDPNGKKEGNVNGHHSSKSNNVLRNLEFMKKIAGGGGNNN
jgi:hypothetical protein